MTGNAHDGHRARLRKRFLEESLDGFAPHEVVELLLFFAIPYRDTNALAHELIDKFGSIAGLIDAPYEELIKTDGIGENAATLIKLIPAVTRRYSTERAAMENVITSANAAGKFLLPRFHGLVNEMALMLCLDAKGKVLGVEKLSEGDVNTTQIGVRRTVAAALKHNASAVILAHNHTSGIAIPSREDVASTERIRAALAAVDVALIDHIVTAEDDFVSMSESGLLKKK